MISTNGLRNNPSNFLVLNDDKTGETYARDKSFVNGQKPGTMVFSESIDQIQKVARYANKTKTPVIYRTVQD